MHYICDISDLNYVYNMYIVERVKGKKTVPCIFLILINNHGKFLDKTVSGRMSRASCLSFWEIRESEPRGLILVAS